MKKLILSELLLLFLATTFISDTPPGWFQQSIPIGNKLITDIHFLDSLNGWVVTDWGPSFDTGYVFKTSNGGNNWDFQYRFHGSFRAIQMTDYNTGYIAGSTGSGRVWKTTDGGSNWLIISSFSGTPMTDLSFVNKDTGWVCINDNISGGVFKTTNGGASWQLQLNDTFAPLRVFFINKDTGWVGSGDVPGRLYRTINGGTNWVQQFIFPSPHFIKDIFFVNRDTGWTVNNSSSDTNGIFKTTNGGNNWFTQTDPDSFGSGVNRIFLINTRKGWIACGFSKILKTNDGVNWGTQLSPSFTNNSIQFVDSLAGWAGGTKLVHTTDGGGPFVGINTNNKIPKDYFLYQNYPNPFNPITKIRYQLLKNSYVRLEVFDINGKEVTELINQKQSGAGTYEVDFNGSDLSSGVYFYRLTVVDEQNNLMFTDTKKMLMIK